MYGVQPTSHGHAEAKRVRPVAARCETCAGTYPWVGKIPCLLSEPDLVLRRWSGELEQFVRQTRTTSARLLAQLALEGVDARGRRRIEAVRSALDEHGARVLALFAAVGISAELDEDIAETKTESYYHQVHRDWGWDEAGCEEPAASLRSVMQALDAGRSPRRILTLGAGACRLPIDLHRACGAEQSVAFDINPLPFLIAERILAGEVLPMFEFPQSPRSSETAAVQRELRARQEVPDGFHLAFADGLDPPVHRGVFDTLFTPWFIDQVPSDLQEVIDLAARLLPVDGQWINHGPLLYHPEHTLFARRYRQDEVLERLTAAGFEVEVSRWERLLYMQSPAGSQGRTEGVLTFRARKTKDTKVAVKPEVEAELRFDDPAAAVPLRDGLAAYQAPHPMFAAVVSLIDGRRSPRDIADVLIEKNGLPAEAALGGVTTVLQEVFRSLPTGDAN